MTKQEEMRGWGNEKLKPAGLDGDATAIAELKRRGNTLEDGRLVKVRTQRYVANQGTPNAHEYSITRTVADGQTIKEEKSSGAP